MLQIEKIAKKEFYHAWTAYDVQARFSIDFPANFKAMEYEGYK